MAPVLPLQVVAAYHSKKGAAQGTFRLLYEGNVVKEDDTPDKVCPTCYIGQHCSFKAYQCPLPVASVALHLMLRCLLL